MPAYNCAEYVSEAIDSVIHQTSTDWELLIADDGSTDGTRDIINRYEDTRIRRVHNEKHLGIVDTRNKLMEHSQGEYIVWQDADDVSMAHRIEKLTSTLDRDPTIAVCGSNCLRVYPFLGSVTSTMYPLSYEEILANVKRNTLPLTGASTALRRSVIQSNVRFREFFNFGGEDPDFLLRILENHKAVNVPDVLYHYRYRRNSVSKSFEANTFLKLYVMELVFFLARQRRDNDGLDGLMDGGDADAFQDFIEVLRRDFESDRSIIYRRSCQSRIRNQDYVYAMQDALSAILVRPDILNNYILIAKLIGSLSKAIGRLMLRSLVSFVQGDRGNNV